MSSHKKRLSAVAGTMAVVLVGGGLAIAYWTTTGSGTGAGTVGTDTPVTVTQDSTVADLVPGGPADPLNFTIENDSDGPQRISSVSISITDVTAPGSCSAADFDVDQPNTGSFVDLPVGDTTFTSGSGGNVANTGAQVSMINSVSNQNGCKGATLEFTYTVS
jgi:hypothetical protein